MNKSESRSRAFAEARLLATITIAILVAAFVSATALMQSRGGQQANSGKASSGPVNQIDLKPEKALFVDEDTPDRVVDRALFPAAQQDGETAAYAIPKVTPAVFDGDVRNLPQVPQRERPERPELEEPYSVKNLLPEAHRKQVQAPNIALAAMPSPIQNFAGLSRTDSCTGGQCGNGIPPDTNGDVGPNHYIQTVNTAVGIYDKTGTLLSSFTFNSLWGSAGTGTPCDANNGGDPVVLYDSLADRWILSDLGFAFSGGNPVAPYYECIAVSKTNDPVSGGWYLYPIRTDTGAAGQPPINTLNDYPKFGVWTDCLYYSANGFANASSYNGVEFASFSRTDMYSGAALTGALGFIATTSNPFSMLPANLTAPASGLPPPAFWSTMSPNRMLGLILRCESLRQEPTAAPAARSVRRPL